MTIICIAGRAGSGKDTVGKILDEILTEQYRKRVLVAHYADLTKYIAKTFFDWDGIKDEDGRSLLQQIGTDVVREMDEDYWVRFIADMLTFFGDSWDYVLLPDFRFPNECIYLESCLPIADKKVIAVNVKRSFLSALTAEQQSHSSETALDCFHFDYTIENNGTYDDLYKYLYSAFVPQILN